MGALAEPFRTFPGTLRSDHPLVSVCAKWRRRRAHHRRACARILWDRGTPFEKLYDQNASILLLGVGFNRCTTLHYAESLVSARRTTISRYPLSEGGVRRWVEKPDMASDRGEHFPEVGRRFLAHGHVRVGRTGAAECMLFSNRMLVNFARDYVITVLR